jgi:hypothetical protein
MRPRVFRTAMISAASVGWLHDPGKDRGVSLLQAEQVAAISGLPASASARVAAWEGRFGLGGNHATSSRRVVETRGRPATDGVARAQNLRLLENR